LIDLSEGAARQLGILGQGITGVRVRKVNPQEQERSALRNGGTASIRTDTPESLLRVLREKLGKMPRPKSVNGVASPVPVASAPVADSGFEYEGAASAQVEASGDGFVREGAKSAPSPAKTGKKPGAPYSTGQTAPVKAVASTKGSDGFVREGGAKGASPKANTPANTAHYIVQIASYASRDRADKLAKYAGASVDASADGKLFRVRYGPYESEDQAKQVLATALNRGYRQARLFRD
jgi:rare lipoprotein A